MKRGFFQMASSGGVFLLFALALALKSGYSYGGGLLALVALLGLPWWWPQRVRNNAGARWLLYLLLLLAVFGALEAVRLDWALRHFDRPIRYSLGALVALFLATYPPSLRALRSGIVVGAWVAGSSALYYSYCAPQLLPLGRAARWLNPIQFGNLSALFALLALWVAMHAYQRQQRGQAVVALLGSGLALGAMLLSESRGSWLALSLVLLVILGHQLARGALLWRQHRGTLVVLLLLLLGALAAAHDIIETRLSELYRETQSYIVHHNEYSSTGARLAMWRFGLHEIATHPLWGATRPRMMRDKAAWVAAGRAEGVILWYSHLHNEYIDTWATTGIVGLMLLLLQLVGPLLWFCRRLQAGGDTAQAAWFGVLLLGLDLGFGLTEVSLHIHNSAVMMYLFPLIIFAVLAGEHHEST